MSKKGTKSKERDISDAYKDMLADMDEDESVLDVQDVSVNRTLADDIIDNIAEPVVRKKQLVCPQCQGTEFIQRGGLSSTQLINVCQKVGCGFKLHTRKKAFMPRAVEHNQGSGGGYYHCGSVSPSRKSLQPTFKRKGKPRK